jgi:hypothetical protein
MSRLESFFSNLLALHSAVAGERASKSFAESGPTEKCFYVHTSAGWEGMLRRDFWKPVSARVAEAGEGQSFIAGGRKRLYKRQARQSEQAGA